MNDDVSTTCNVYKVFCISKQINLNLIKYKENEVQYLIDHGIYPNKLL